jgi:hypothetical protein
VEVMLSGKMRVPGSVISVMGCAAQTLAAMRISAAALSAYLLNGRVIFVCLV